jgi:arylsulfatase A-like enzyme
MQNIVLKAAACLLCCVVCSCSHASKQVLQDKVEKTDRPNVLFLFTDDQRNDTVNALGNKFIKTPNIDRLARAGVSFMNAYIMGGSSPAVCSPSRASLFSGRTLWNLENQGKWGFEISEKYRTLPQVFRENGYVTFGTGKNEPGKAGHFNRSFSTGDKILFKGMTRSQYKLPLFSYSPENDYSNKKSVLHTEKHSAEIYADACINFLEDQKENSKPFFAYVAFQTPHDPRQSPSQFREMYEDAKMKIPESFMPNHPFDNGMLKIRDEKLAPFPRTKKIVQKHIADYYAVITHTDAQIGRILESLEKTGKLENTIIVFSSDNGLAVGRHGLMGKQNVYDHSVHVPLIISGPGIDAGKTRQQLCYIYDIYPTLCERAGIKTPETVQFKSLNDVIYNAEAEHRDNLYFAFMSWQRSVRDERYKLIEYCVDNSRHTQLFDLVDDPMEIKNLADDLKYAEKLKELRALLKKEAVKLNDGNVPFEFADKQGKDFWNMYKSLEKYK